MNRVCYPSAPLGERKQVLLPIWNDRRDREEGQSHGNIALRRANHSGHRSAVLLISQSRGLLRVRTTGTKFLRQRVTLDRGSAPRKSMPVDEPALPAGLSVAGD